MKNSNDKKTELVQARMTPQDVAMLQTVADARNCSVGAVVRWAVLAVVRDEYIRLIAKG